MKSQSLKSLAEYKIALISLISLSFVVFSGKSYENLLRGIDSNIHAKVSMSVTAGKGIAPLLPIPDTNFPDTPNTQKTLEPESYFNDHPFFLFWINGWVMRALGPSAWSARLLTASFSVGCVLLTLWLGALLHSRVFGFIAALFLLFSRDIILTGATVSLDPFMMFFILLSFILWIKEQWPWVGLVTGVGLWIKTPVVLLIFPTAFTVSLIRGQLQRDIRKIAKAAALALGVGSLVWLTTGWVGGWKLVQDYWIRQVWGTAIGGRNTSTGVDPWSVFQMIRTGFLPGFPFLVIGLIQVLWKRQWKNSAFVVSGVAVSVVALAITPMKFRMDYYFNPIFPFLALLSAFSVIDLVKPIEKSVYVVFSCLVAPLLAFLLCTPTQLGPEAFVALKRFMPFIQTYGSCDDEILIVPGGEPIGSSLDYGLVLNFYTGHSVSVEGCMAANAAIRKNHPKWVLISRDHLKECLTAEERSKYGTQLKMGGQYLLTNLIPSSQTLDLTPLERELKPSIDCRPPAYPKDIYHPGF